MPFEALRFFHAAGVQLDHQLHDAGAVDEQTKSILIDATLTAFERLVEACVEHDVSFLLLTGNTFHEAERSLRARVTIVEGLNCLREAGIDVFVVPGPADPLAAWQAIPRLPDNVTIFNPDTDEPTAIMRDGHVIATIQACKEQAGRSSVGAADVSRDPSGPRSHPFRVGILSPGLTPDHRTAHELLDAVLTENPVEYVAAPSAFDQLTVEHSNGVAHGPGSVCPISGRDDGRHGATLVSVDADAQIGCESIQLSPVRRERFDVTVTQETDWDELIAGMRDQVEQVDDLQAVDTLLVTWRLSGHGLVIDDLSDPESQAELFELLDLNATLPDLNIEQRLLLTDDGDSGLDSAIEETWYESDIASSCGDSPNPMQRGFFKRLDSSESVVDDVLKRASSKSGQSRSAWVSRLALLAGRVNADRVAAQAGRLGASWFNSTDAVGNHGHEVASETELYEPDDDDEAGDE